MENKIKYCCKKMKELDEEGIIDYCVPNLTTLDAKGKCYPIYFCPFCGKIIKGCKEFFKKLKNQVKDINDRKIKTVSLNKFTSVKHCQMIPKGMIKKITKLKKVKTK